MVDLGGSRHWNWHGARNEKLFKRWQQLKKEKLKNPGISIYMVLSKEFNTTGGNIQRIVLAMKKEKKLDH